MDAAALAPYMRRRTMNLLLLLSAFMTALTGVIGGVRAPQVAAEQVASVAAAATAALPAQRGGGERPIPAAPRLLVRIDRAALVLPAIWPVRGERRRI